MQKSPIKDQKYNLTCFLKKYLPYLFRTSPGAKFLSDPQWITNAGNHLFQHVQIFLGMVLHSQVTVRHALQRMCSKLQRYSWKSLGNTRVLQVRISTPHISGPPDFLRSFPALFHIRKNLISTFP